MSDHAVSSNYIELRSDTFTQPTEAMRQAIAGAVVGDDMVGEDPTVNELQRRVADLLGKPDALFMCSGTQSNQSAVWTHCRPGDELLIESSGHIANYEAGGPAVLSGVTVRRVQGTGGMLSVEQLAGELRSDDVHICPQRLLCLENTTNMGGGRVWPFDQFRDVCQWARQHGFRVHLDGARLFNAVVASGVAAHRWAAEVDSVSICFSKGLGCPMGSILVSDEQTIASARRARKIFGGALRQAGVVAAAALHAVEHHVERLAEDHENASLLAKGIAQIDALNVDFPSVETNMVFATVDPAWGTASEFAAALNDRGVKLYDVGRDRLRAVTHLNVSSEDVDQAIEIFAEVASAGAVVSQTSTAYPA